MNLRKKHDKINTIVMNSSKSIVSRYRVPNELISSNFNKEWVQDVLVYPIACYSPRKSVEIKCLQSKDIYDCQVESPSILRIAK